MTNLGRILQRARKQKGASLRALAHLAGVSNAYLCQLEQSKDRLLQVSWVNLQKISRAYGVPLEELELRMRKEAQKTGVLTAPAPRGQ